MTGGKRSTVGAGPPRRRPAPAGWGPGPSEAPVAPEPSPVAPEPSSAAPEPSPAAAPPPGAGAPAPAGPSAAEPAADLAWGARLRWGLVGLGVTAALLYLTWSVLGVLVASAVLAYLLDRPVSWLARRGMSRDRAFAILLGGAVLGLLVVLAIVVPLVAGQMIELAGNLTPYLTRLGERVLPWKAELEARLGVEIPLDLPGLAQVAPEYVRRLAEIPDARNVAQAVVSQVAEGGLRVVLSVLTLSLLPFFTWYLCAEWPGIVRFGDELVPPRHRPEVRRIAAEIDGRIFAFVEGQVLLCSLLGVLYSVGLWLCDIDLAITIGLLSGALFVVPYLGTLVGAGLSSVLALLKFGFDWHVLGAIGTFVVVQGLEGSVLTPRLVGERVGLHPMVVMVALVVAGNLLGVWGLLLAVPLTAALHVLASTLLRRYRESGFYGGAWSGAGSDRSPTASPSTPSGPTATG